MRDWSFVDDHCRAIRRVIAAGVPGETYDNCERANLNIVEQICDLVDELRPDLPHAPCRSLVEFVRDRPGHDRRYAINSATVARELNWQSRVNFETWLRQTVVWYLSNHEWDERFTSGKNQRERLGLITVLRT